MSTQPVQSAEAIGSPRAMAPYTRPATDATSLGGSARAERAVSTDGVLKRAYAAFVVDPDTSRVQVRIVDAATKRVLRAIPPHDVEHLARTLREYSDAPARPRNAAPPAASLGL